jgi:hypothetical protein
MYVRIVLLLSLVLAACQQEATPTPPLPTLTSLRFLTFWEPVTDTLATAEEVQEWRFVGQAGDAISLRHRAGKRCGVRCKPTTA